MRQLSQSVTEEIRSVLVDILGIDTQRAVALEDETPLFGAMPELDSMAVATVLTELEDRFGILVDDDDVDAETFETFGNLVAFAEGKVAALGG